MRLPLRDLTLIGAAALALVVSTAVAQQPLPSEINDALNRKVIDMQEMLDRSYLAQAQLRKALTDADADLKWLRENPWIAPKQP